MFAILSVFLDFHCYWQITCDSAIWASTERIFFVAALSFFTIIYRCSYTHYFLTIKKLDIYHLKTWLFLIHVIESDEPCCISHICILSFFKYLNTKTTIHFLLDFGAQIRSQLALLVTHPFVDWPVSITTLKTVLFETTIDGHIKISEAKVHW